MLHVHKKIEPEVDGKISLCSSCIGCSFKKFETVGEEKLSYLLKSLI